MAILPEQNAEVVVLVEGQPALEYDNDDDTELDTDREITKYVEAVSGKEFAFLSKVGPGFRWRSADMVAARLSIDGKRRTGIALPKGTSGMDIGVSGMNGGEWSGSGSNAQQFKFTFANLETRDMEKGDDISKFKDQYSKLGSFTVELWRTKVRTRSEGSSKFLAEELKAIPEKALKGRPLDVGTSFKAMPGVRPGNISSDEVDDEPFATFHFKYRTRKALKSLLIIERTPDPVLLEERPIEELSREEMQELLRRQRVNAAIKQEHRPTKRARAATNSTPMPPLKTSKGANGQTVYHLDSDGEDDAPPQNKDRETESSPADKDIEVVTI